MFWIILIIVQLIVWYLTFFKSKRVKYEAKQEGYRTVYEYIETEERFRFPLWALLVGFLISLIPIIGLAVILWATIKAASMTDREYESIFEGNRPSFYLVKIFTKEV